MLVISKNKVEFINNVFLLQDPTKKIPVKFNIKDPDKYNALIRFIDMGPIGGIILGEYNIKNGFLNEPVVFPNDIQYVKIEVELYDKSSEEGKIIFGEANIIHYYLLGDPKSKVYDPVIHSLIEGYRKQEERITLLEKALAKKITEGAIF